MTLPSKTTDEQRYKVRKLAMSTTKKREIQQKGTKNTKSLRQEGFQILEESKFSMAKPGGAAGWDCGDQGPQECGGGLYRHGKCHSPEQNFQ